jgi:hypothetical protein
MFVNERLQNHLETSSSINSQALVLAEWNMNIADNISTIGNYRYRPLSDPATTDGVYSLINNSFDINDADNEIKFYAGATDADVVVDGGLDNDEDPITFVAPNEKERLLYSLEECFKRFRPRSGINKLRYFEDGHTHFVNIDLANRPRYYMSSKNDSFKYWTSYRKENGIERGIANQPQGGLNYIDDAAPFVVYKDEIPANRLVVKMQTNVGSVNLGPFYENGSSFEDPFFGDSNKTTPTTWSIQVLKNNNWVDVASFNPLSVRKNNLPIINSDGYVELAYGLILPDQYKDTIHFAGSYPFESLLPAYPSINSAYFVKENANELGKIYVWNGESYDSFVPEYGWYLTDEDISERTSLVSEFVNPEYFINGGGDTQYKEFDYIRGIRVVVKTMNKINSTFDLIELSPRLLANLTERTKGFNINKSASDLGVSGMPVGQLLASNGSLEIFDYDDSFNQSNTNSILSTFVSNNLQIKLFETILVVDNDQVESFTLPLKTFYAEGFPETEAKSRSFTLELRDLFFYFETLNAPQLLVEEASLSYAVSFLLDSIGFSNYSFKRVDEEDDPIIPYFFVRPETTIAQVLQDLAIATQSAMFFDEYNNFVIMSKNYIMPSLEERETDVEIIGSVDQEKNGIVENKNKNNKLANIVDIASRNQEVFNDGKIIYEEKYIQKDYGSLRQANFVSQDKNWIYKPVLLWEVAGTPPIRSVDESQEQASSYTLSAVPLNSDLSDVVPFVQNNELQNNVIDFGEGAYWVARYNGYFYANGEIIKYDAIEYSVSGIGNVWIDSVREYQNYYSKIKFGGKIYPTGRVRIYAEPFYEEIDGIVVMKNGVVNKHGRAQFGTSVSYHHAGLPQYWSDTSDTAPVQGVNMDSRYLFSTFRNTRLSGVYNQEPISYEVTAEIEDPSTINNVAYGQGKWIAVGDDGNFRKSSDGESWSTFSDEGLDASLPGLKLKAIAYGQNKWVAVGNKDPEPGETRVAIVYSEDGESWNEIEEYPTVYSSSMNDVAFNGSLWMTVGNRGVVMTSPDGIEWTVKDPLLDFKISTNKNTKKLTRTFKQTGISISKITSKASGEPAEITRKNHNLKENEKIKLFTSGTLPAGLVANQTYYVKVKNKDTFFVKDELEDEQGVNITSKGSGRHTYSRDAATFTINKHGYSNGMSLSFIRVGPSMPPEIQANSKYFVRVVDSNNVSLSNAPNGDLIDFISGQSSSSHKVKDFTGSQLNTVTYGNGTWAVGGKQGVFSTTTDTENWVARDIGFSGSEIYKILFANSRWAVVGASGRATRSTNLTSWSRFDTKISKTQRTIAFGSGRWIVAGDNGTMSTSTDLSRWSTIKPDLGKGKVRTVAYNGSHWIAVADKLKISKSTNGTSWSAKSQDNVGELLFNSDIPHHFMPLDMVILGSTGKISEKNTTKITAISTGNPAIFTSKDHKLRLNDEIMLETTDDLPAEFQENFTYYAKPLSSNTFSLSEEINGTAIASGGGDSGDHFFYFPPVVTGERYWVTPKNISPNSFTLARSRLKAKNGVTLVGKGLQEGTHTVTLNVPENFSSLNQRDLVSSISTYLDENEDEKIRINISRTLTSRRLGVGDRIFFAIAQGGEILEKKTPTGIVRFAPYYVHSIVGTDDRSFLISEEYGGNAVNSIEEIDLEEYLDNGENLYVIFNPTSEILNSTILSPNSVEFSVGNLLEINSTAGELVSPTRVSAIRKFSEIKKEVTISIGDPAVITCVDHGLFNMDPIKFTTTGTLPYGIDKEIIYYVDKIDDDRFSLLLPGEEDSYILVETKSPDEENLDLEIDLDELDLLDEIEDDPDTEINEREEAFRKFYNYREQSGKHYFVKSFNDINRITLTREVAEVIPEYSITEEEVVIDEEEGETEIQINYQNVSAKNLITAIQELEVESGPAGIDDDYKNLARAASRNGIVKNYFANSSFSETDVNKFLAPQTGTVQSSALVFNGPAFEEDGEDRVVPIDFVSYIHKQLDDKYTHFGTRMRIVGKQSKEQYEQNILRAMDYFVNPNQTGIQPKNISGGSAGLGLMLNPENNNGYFFEVIALPKTNADAYSSSSEDPRFEQLEEQGLFNVVFYKTVRKVPNEAEQPVTDSSQAIPIKLWQGVTSIIADDGTFVGQSRMINEKNPSVYDISVEYEDLDDNTRRFYLMINNIIIGIVDDKEPLPIYQNMALFVRGTTRAMFENIYAIANNYTQNTIFDIEAPVNSVFGTEKINVSESFRKYAISGAVQSTYLSGIGTSDIPKYNMYFEEFGTIMRECAYFNVKYDKAYPALYARISDTFNKMKGYTVSGFVPGAYGAEFLVFNNTDTALNLDETSGNYLRIQGVSFTQNLARELTVDEYFNEISNFANPDIKEDGTIVSPIRERQRYLDIKNSRLTYGRKEFVIESSYIQSQDEANELMSWMIDKTMRPRKSVGLQLFAMPTVQLGDIVSIDYKSSDNIEQISSDQNRFVVYNIEYLRNDLGPVMTVYLSEVI